MNESNAGTPRNRIFERRGAVAACAVLMLANQFAPIALADDVPCHCRMDFNCDRVVDGGDLGFLLSSWGADTRVFDLDGDCEVGGGDLGMMLGAWGALPDVPELEPVSIGKEVVTFCLGDQSITGVVSSDLQVETTRKILVGWATVNIGNDVFVSMEFSGGSAVINVGDTEVVINGNLVGHDVTVNGEIQSASSVLEGFESDLSSGSYEASDWREPNQAIMGLTLLHMTDSYARAMISQQAADVSHGFWCKAAAIAAGAAITALATLGCLALTASCAIGTFVTFAGIAIPCAALIALCAGGVFAGGAAAYELALAFWGD